MVTANTGPFMAYSSSQLPSHHLVQEYLEWDEYDHHISPDFHPFSYPKKSEISRPFQGTNSRFTVSETPTTLSIQWLSFEAREEELRATWRAQNDGKNDAKSHGPHLKGKKPLVAIALLGGKEVEEFVGFWFPPMGLNMCWFPPLRMSCFFEICRKITEIWRS